MRLKTTSVSRAAALLAAVGSGAAAAAPDSGALIARLARQPPASIAFVEVRFSPLLVEPLTVGGTLVYEGSGTLQRRVEAPYSETTTIRDESVRVERADEPPRTFALRRAPELRGLLTGMIGLLTGDGAYVAEHFEISATGDDARWQLDLVPTDGRLRQRLHAIVVTGAAAEPRCFVIEQTEGSASVMLLGAAATSPPAPPLALPALLAHCGAE